MPGMRTPPTEIGQLCGSLPDGDVAPDRISQIELPPSQPLLKAARTAAACLSSPLANLVTALPP